jgi:cytoskeletal protein CcmA (bactofilin family)
LFEKGQSKSTTAEASPSPFIHEAPEFRSAPERNLGPELVIGPTVSVNGKIAFQREIQIDGVFEGEFEGNGKIVIGRDGFVKADMNLQEANISGKVEGNITVKGRLILQSGAEVKGNITATSLSVEEGVSIVGQVCVPVGEMSSFT